MTPTDYKLTQAQYARIYGVTERSIRTYQRQNLPLDNTGRTVLLLMDRKTRPPGLNMSEVARLNYNREAGIASTPTPARSEQLEELIWQFWDAHNAITCFVREFSWPNNEEIQKEISGVSTTVQKLRTLAGIPDLPVDPSKGEAGSDEKEE